jgi:TPR repeat protein
MKTSPLLASVLIALTCNVCAQELSPAQVAETAVARMKHYKQEALKLAAPQVFDEIERLRTTMAIKSRESAIPDLTDEDTLKASGYASALEAKRNAKEPHSAYYWGRYYSRICSALETNKSIGDVAQRCWAETLESFKIASDGGIPRASFNIGLMYENGWGVNKSMYLAAEWYTKAAEKYMIGDLREGALESIEAALRVVPEHPVALRYKARLLK